MKKILFLLFVSPFFYAQNSFEIANKLYQKQQYQEALTMYQKIVENNQHAANLYFNMGNCYYKLNKIAPTIFYYQKALLLEPNNKEVLNNLKFAQKRTIDAIKVTPEAGFLQLLRKITSSLHYNTWAFLVVGFAILLFVFFCLYYFSAFAKSKRFYFSMLLIAFILGFLCLVGAAIEKNYFINYNPAVVFSESILLHSEPLDQKTTNITLHEGTLVFVKEKVANYSKIALTDGSEAWIKNAAIKEVKKDF